MRDAIHARLKEAAFSYLARRGASAARLRHVLLRRLARWKEGADLAAEERAALAEAVVEEMAALDLVDDRRLARERVDALLRRGLGPAAIRARLRAQGFGAGDVAAAIDAVYAAQGRDAALLQAALAYARRRRLGPFGDGRARGDPRARERALAAFRRRGLPDSLARLILEAEDETTLNARLLDAGWPPIEAV
ncbi:MAG: hypothetical protein KatS3mg119_0044 [Rhodothalassiaceae bacterium]|nr:MAG: hypothetical protein KatS3mg119_0044 [Rhodothalassiaceae bacterium]